jgi:hypothetical protein
MPLPSLPYRLALTRLNAKTLASIGAVWVGRACISGEDNADWNLEALDRFD